MKFLSRLGARIKAAFSKAPTAPTLNQLLEQAGVPRSITPELLEVARLGGLCLDGDGDGSGDGSGSGDGAGSGDGGGSGDGSGDGDGSGSGDGDGSGEGDGDGEGKPKEPDWKAESRKHERRSKKEKEAREDAEKKLKAREDEDKTEQQKAIDKAREEGKSEALTVAEKERRNDRLESAITRAAGKKIEIGEGEDKKTVRFDDPEDAELYLRAKIAKGDFEEDDFFDDSGKVKADLVAETLKEILEEKPRLAEDGDAGSKTANGGADGGKGKGAATKETDMNDLLRRK